MLKYILVLNNHEFVIAQEDLVMWDKVPDLNKGIIKRSWCVCKQQMFSEGTLNVL